MNRNFMLNELEERFIEYYNLNALKIEAIEALKKYHFEDEESMREFIPFLPKGVILNELDIEHKNTTIILSGKMRGVGFFRVRLIAKDRVEGRHIFWYELEFDGNGEVTDSYFGIYDVFISYD
ncbi:MAG: hypothetical protein R3E32_09320 [Chitinophagales bacterium]